MLHHGIKGLGILEHPRGQFVERVETRIAESIARITDLNSISTSFCILICGSLVVMLKGHSALCDGSFPSEGLGVTWCQKHKSVARKACAQPSEQSVAVISGCIKFLLMLPHMDT